MIPTPSTYEVKRLAKQALEMCEKEGISTLEAIHTICNNAFVPQTDDALTIGNVQAYLYKLRDAVVDEVYAQLHNAADPAKKGKVYLS